MVHDFAVPADTRARLASTTNGWGTCRNLSLLLHQYVPHEVIQTERILAREGDRKKLEKEAGGAKLHWLVELAKRSQSPGSPGALFDGYLHEAWLRRWEATANAHQATRFAARCAWRLVVGLGGQSPVETDLLVHPIYGIPYVPGSALKGLARAYALLEGLGQDTDIGETKAGDAGTGAGGDAETPEPASAPVSSLDRIFGTQKRAGSAIFFDGVPAPGLRLDVDVMNPHYPRYYRDPKGGVAPGDDQDPIPVPFLTVAPECEFHFAVAPRGPSDAESRDDARLAAEWLKGALRDYGVGAKTNSGYGRFERFEVPKNSR